jgi:predicted TIM-barrel fold metal-dependent hydrolase
VGQWSLGDQERRRTVRNDVKVYDADTHIGASAESLEPYLASTIRELLPNLDDYRTPIRRSSAGETLQPPYVHRYQVGSGFGAGWGSDVPRMLGEAAARANAERRPQKFMGSKWPAKDADWVAASRIRDMDEEGVDVQVMVPTVPWGHDKVAVDIEFMRANHRFLDDFCSAYADRLKALLVINAKFVKESVDEIKTWGRSRWAVGVWVNLPLDFPLDHPDLHPIWSAVEQAGLCVVHHSFSGGYPGYRDTWSNPFIGRTASHPWGAMRAVAAFFGAGLMDRYTSLRFAILESGFGWLPFWAVRMQDQVEYMGYVPELQHTMMEYMSNGRFFASIVLHEGAEMIRMVSGFLGNHVLMFSTDYPHPETRFPDSVDLVLGWKQLDADLLRQIMWDNAVRCFGEP